MRTSKAPPATKLTPTPSISQNVASPTKVKVAKAEKARIRALKKNQRTELEKMREQQNAAIAKVHFAPKSPDTPPQKNILCNILCPRKHRALSTQRHRRLCFWQRCALQKVERRWRGGKLRRDVGDPSDGPLSASRRAPARRSTVGVATPRARNQHPPAVHTPDRARHAPPTHTRAPFHTAARPGEKERRTRESRPRDGDVFS